MIEKPFSALPSKNLRSYLLFRFYMLMYGPFRCGLVFGFGSVTGSPRFYGHLTPFYCHTAAEWVFRPLGHLVTWTL